MSNLLSRRARLRFGIAFCLIAAFIQPILAVPFQPGNLFVAYGGSNIGVFNMNGTLVQTLSVLPSSFGTGTTLSGGGGVALDEFGNLYVTVSNDGTGKLGIMKFTVNGTPVEGFPKGYTISGVYDFRGLAVRDGRIYVATDRGIRVFSADGTRLSSEDFGGTLAFRDLAMDRHGNLYALRHNEVRKWSAGNFSGDGTRLFSIPSEDPRAIVIDENDNIYITFEGTKVVRKYDSTGTHLATYSTPSDTGSLIGLDYDPGTQRLFASHTGTDIGQILWIDKNASDGATMSAFGPTNLSGVRWLAVYPTPEPTTAILLAAGLLLLKRRFRKG